MKLTLKKSIGALLVIPAMVLSLGVAAQPAFAADCSGGGGLSLSQGACSAQGNDQQGSASCLFDTGNGDCQNGGLFKQVTNVLLYVIGAISVIMLVIGGVRYTISGGDQKQVEAAKNTILYAIVGIIVAILAYAVVNFVIGNFANHS